MHFLQAFRRRRSGTKTAAAGSGVQPWLCGRLGPNEACRAGPSARGRCGSRYACEPSPDGEGWRCRRADKEGGPCAGGPLENGTCRIPEPPCRPVRTLRAKREVAAKWVAVVTAGAVALAISHVSDLQLFTPGPLTTAHGSIGACKTCHTGVADGQLGWLHAVFASADTHADSKACLTCHKMPETALQPHGLSEGELAQISELLSADRKDASASLVVRLSGTLFPIGGTERGEVFCATCHREHKGMTNDLKILSDAQCHTCHKVQFKNFGKDHPEFENFPFNRRTRIAFDHAGHFGKHFPELRDKKNDQTKAIPAGCDSCHTSSADTRHMGVKPFAEVCSTCHIGQIVGKDRATGPKGIALLTLPGIDLETLRDKKAAIGEWPEDSEGEITPLMRLLIGYDDERRKMLAAVDDLDLLDLTEASDNQLEAVEKLVWEIKSLVHALVTSSASDVLQKIGTAAGARVDTDLIGKLTANMPHDVLMNAQREWLPNLNAEIENRPSGVTTTPPWTRSVPLGRGAHPALRSGLSQDAIAQLRQPDQNSQQFDGWRVDPFGRLIKGNQPPADPDAEEPEDKQEPEPAKAAPEPEAKPEPKTAEPKERPEKSAKQAKEPEKSPDQAPVASAAVVDAEDWAAFGGWYRKDFSILYKPTGHRDGFLRAWLDFSGRLHTGKKENLVSPVFAMLTSKDAQGQCTKCHSVDKGPNGSRTVNWRPSSLATRSNKFTNFDHEPHFGLVGDKGGCLTCHKLDDKPGFMDTYKATDPAKHRSNFKQVKKEACSSCHGTEVARQDCLLCHTYHVNGVTTPITMTKIPGAK